MPEAPVRRPRRSLRSWAPFAVVMLAALIYGLQAPNAYQLALGVNAGVYAIAAIGVTLAVGGAGQLALGQAGFMAIGAYATAFLTTDHGMTFLLALVIGVLLALAAGTLVGYVALRLTGNYLAMATLAAGSIIYTLLLVPSRLGGSSGYAGIPLPSILGFEFSDPFAQYVLVWVCVALVFLVARAVLASRLGRELAALRDDEVAASLAGVDLTRRKVQVFAISAALGGLAGAVNAPLQSAIDPGLFSTDISIQLFIMVVIGGLGSVPGSVVGAAVVVAIGQIIPGAGTWALGTLGIVVVVLMALLPDGLVDAGQRLRRLRAERRDLPAQGTPS